MDEEKKKTLPNLRNLKRYVNIAEDDQISFTGPFVQDMCVICKDFVETVDAMSEKIEGYSVRCHNELVC